MTCAHMQARLDCHAAAQACTPGCPEKPKTGPLQLTVHLRGDLGQCGHLAGLLGEAALDNEPPTGHLCNNLTQAGPLTQPTLL